MTVYHSGDESGKNPVWYWRRGLHDAQITSAAFEKDTRRLKLTLDSKGALYEQVTQITFSDCEIENDFAFSERDYWWLEEVLTYEHGRFLLTLRLHTPRCKERIAKLRFRDADVTYDR